MDSSICYEYWWSVSYYTYGICRFIWIWYFIYIFIEGKVGYQNVEVMNAFIPPIAVSIGILSIGVICGGLTYTLAYLKK